MKIVDMTSLTIDDVARLEEQCFSHPWSRDSIEESFNNPYAFFFVAKNDDNKVVGYMSYYIVRDEAFVYNVAVDENCRRQGIGHALVEHAVNHAKDNGASFLSLEVRVSNAAAIALYSSFDFEIEGSRKKFYRDPVEDALIMTCHFEQAHVFDPNVEADIKIL